MTDEREPDERPGFVIGPGAGGDADVGLAGRGEGGGSPRTDEQIARDIRARLDASSLPRETIAVRVDGRDVTLDGAVPDEAARHAAEQIADSVAGVRRVRSRLRIERSGAP
jgi:osmotically-inducible protein OsmY